MEFGWREVDAKPTDSFAIFLRQLMEAYPSGACAAAMAPYVDHTSFVGKLERIADDLDQALTMAGETFDPDALRVEPVNTSSSPAIIKACVAPLALLEAFMQADAAFCERFSYRDVPKSLVGAPISSPWPKLKSKRRSADDSALPLSRTRFVYHLDDGSRVGGNPDYQRLQWSLIQTLNGLERPGRTAVISEIDPFPAYLLAAKPGAGVTFVAADVRVHPQRAPSHLKISPEMTDFRTFHKAPEEADFDTIVLVDSAELSGALEGELLLTAKRLKPGGQLLLVAPVLHVDAAISTTFNAENVGRQGCMTVYRSLAEWRTVLGNCGFEAMEVTDSFDHAPPEAIGPSVEALAHTFSVDPAHLLGKVMLTARRRADHLPTMMRDLWIRRQLMDIDCAYDSLPSVIEARLLMLEDQVRTERLWRARAEQGVADREAQMRTERQEAEADKIALSYSVDQARRAQAEKQAVQAELDNLRALVSHLGADPKILNFPTNDLTARKSPSSLSFLLPSLRQMPRRP